MAGAEPRFERRECLVQSRDAALEAHLEADAFTQWLTQLVRNPAGDTACRNPARLRVCDLAGNATAGLQAQFRELRGFAGARITTDNDHLMLDDGADNR